MGHQVIRQPDGKLAIWDSSDNAWVAFDCDPAEVVDIFVDNAAANARRQAERVVGLVADDQAAKAYYDYTVTFEQADALAGPDAKLADLRRELAEEAS